jgi:putative transposase
LGPFSWQEGFGGFSLGKTQLAEKIKYIENQQEHHRVKTFGEEYLAFLEEYDIAYDERYIFKPIE